jgi:hypothetical protein
MKIKSKTFYAGLFVDKYFFILEDDTQVQVPFSEWEKYNKGDNYISKETKSRLDELARIAQKNGLYRLTKE